MANILLIAPTSVGYGRNNKRMTYFYPPTGLCYIAGALRAAKHCITMLDLTLFSKSEFDNVIRDRMFKNSIDAVGITATTPQIYEAFDILRVVKNINRKCLTVVGGPHVSAMPRHVLKNEYVDVIVIGEGEETAVELFNNLDSLSEIVGIGYKSNSSIIINNPRPLINNLDSIPYPAFDLLNMERYGDVFLGKGLGIASSRGCPYSCAFCAKTVLGRKPRFRSRNNFVDELIYWKDKYNIMNFFFQDEVFSFDKERAANVCKDILNNRLNIKWSAVTRANLLTKDLMKIMQDAGCINLGIGVESADKKVLEACNKNIRLDEIKLAIKWANELKIVCHGYFIIGLPYETKVSIMNTINFARDAGFDYVSFATLVPLPDTEIWNIVEKGELLRWKNKDFSAFGKYSDPVVETKDLTVDELKYYFRLAHSRFYLNPKYIWKRIKLLRPLTLLKDLSSAIKIIKFIR